MKWLFFVVLFLASCQNPHFDSQASFSGAPEVRCPVDLRSFKKCVRDEFGDIVDDYFGNIKGESNLKRGKALLIIDLLNRKIFHSCGEETGLLEELRMLKASEENQCKQIDLVSSLLTLYDQLILEIANRAIRKYF